MNSSQVPIQQIDVSAYLIPTDLPESDGTLQWDSTTLVVVEATAGDRQGFGYGYADTATAHLIKDKLATLVQGQDALDVPGIWRTMVQAIRNLGRPGIASMAIAAVDAALWDLKGQLLQLPVARLLGTVRKSVAVYGSGGFTSYTLEQLEQQLGNWVAGGIPRVKMKIGRQPAHDLARVQAVRTALGPEPELFVDANGAYTQKQALFFAEHFAPLGVRWFEEPVPSSDLAGLHWLRNRAPAGMVITAGEYGYDLVYFRRMLAAGAVDVLMADATRCAGITGFLKVGALCEAYELPLSAHCAPSLHVHPCCALGSVRHMEYFHDHVRIEHLLFDGVLDPIDGRLYPDLSRPGLGLALKKADAAPYAVSY